MIVSSAKLGWVSLKDVVRLEQGTEPSAIDRLNRQRQVMLLANVKPGGSQAAVIQNFVPGQESSLGSDLRHL